jgi:hypothetical protein
VAVETSTHRRLVHIRSSASSFLYGTSSFDRDRHHDAMSLYIDLEFLHGPGYLTSFLLDLNRRKPLKG